MAILGQPQRYLISSEMLWIVLKIHQTNIGRPWDGCAHLFSAVRVVIGARQL